MKLKEAAIKDCKRIERQALYVSIGKVVKLIFAAALIGLAGLTLTHVGLTLVG